MSAQFRWNVITSRLTILVFTSCLVATLGTSPGAEARGCGVLTDIATLGITYAIDGCKPFSVESEPHQTTTTCTPPMMTGQPQFLSQPHGAARYPFSGSCTSPDLPGIQLKYRWEGSWTPSETNPNKPNASESVEIIGYEPFLPGRAPGGKIYMYWTGRCNYDPWLRPDTSGGCRRFGEFIPPDMREVIPDMTKTDFPQTKNIIPAKDRQRLSAEYLRVNPPVASKFNPAATTFTSPLEMFTFTKPSNGERVMQGQLVVTAQPPKIGATTVAELEFRWLDAPPNQPYVNTFAVDSSKLTLGYAVAQQVTRGYAGRWEVRARSSGKSVPGPWSLAVPFQLLLSQPTQSQSQSAPLPKSSILQTPQQGATGGTTMIRPQTTPSQPSGSFGGMIMRRGVDEKGGKEGNETVDSTPESEKKP